MRGGEEGGALIPFFLFFQTMVGLSFTISIWGLLLQFSY